MAIMFVADHAPVLAQWADTHTVALEVQQHTLAAGNFLQKLGKAVFGFLAGIFVVGALIGLAIGFFVGRAVGRRGSASVGS